MRNFLAIIIALILLLFVFKIFSILFGTACGFISVVLFVMFYPQLKKAFK